MFSAKIDISLSNRLHFKVADVFKQPLIYDIFTEVCGAFRRYRLTTQTKPENISVKFMSSTGG